MEGLVRPAWNGRRVLVTGHTGFKGSWLALWLGAMGAKVTGFALPPPTEPSLFAAARIGELIHHVDGDVRVRLPAGTAPNVDVRPAAAELGASVDPHAAVQRFEEVRACDVRAGPPDPMQVAA